LCIVGIKTNLLAVVQKQNVVKIKAYLLPRPSITMANDVSMLTRLALAWWQLEHKNDRVFVNGVRIHHGEAGIIIRKLGKWLGAKELVQIGDELIKDDLRDRREWFTFKAYEQELKEAKRKGKRFNAIHTTLHL
jgi:hypothetical protein